MKSFDLNILEKDPNQDGLYDFTQITYKSISGPNIYSYLVDTFDEMRIDIISNKLYRSTDYIDFLLSFNSIDNPLNIKEGDTIYYCDSEDVELFRVTPDKPKELKSSLLNTNKQTKKDTNRQSYIEGDFALPPTLLETPTESVQVKGDNIVIGVNENTSI
jgi:hypothetical protein